MNRLLTTLSIFIASLFIANGYQRDISHKFDLCKIIDPLERVTEEQKAKITKNQKLILQKHECVVSYAFYGGKFEASYTRVMWRKHVNQDTTKHFHILINIGVFRKGHTVDVFHRFPPNLEDVYEVTRILDGLKRDLQSENDVNSVLEQSFIALDSEITFLQAKPSNEKDSQQNKDARETKKMEEFITKIVTIAGIAFAGLIAFILACYILLKLKNKKSYSFPEVTGVRRLGAPFAASSISKPKK